MVLKCVGATEWEDSIKISERADRSIDVAELGDRITRIEEMIWV